WGARTAIKAPRKRVSTSFLAALTNGSEEVSGLLPSGEKTKMGALGSLPRTADFAASIS
ncbi:hypothetical protein V5799_024791, partial [Amblyomma americanum]